MAPLLCVLVAFVVGVSSGDVSQARPDFSGRWIIVGAPIGSPASEPARPGSLGGVFEVRQDQKTLTLVTGNDPDFRETTLPLNGDAVTTRLGLNPGMGIRPELGLEFVSKVTWEGDRLIVTMNVGGSQPPTTVSERLRTVQSWSLDAKGDLVIETIRPLLPQTTSRATYRRFR